MSDELLFLGMEAQKIHIQQPPMIAEPQNLNDLAEINPALRQAQELCFAQEAQKIEIEEGLLPPVHDRSDGDSEAGMAAMLMFYQLGGCRAMMEDKKREEEEELDERDRGH